MSALPERYFTPEEYLDLEVKAEYKSQYVGGEIFAMAGTQPWHTEVEWQFDHRARITLPRTPLQSVLHRSAHAGESRRPIYLPGCRRTLRRAEVRHEPQTLQLTNPQVIFEVLSPSEAFDRGDKFARHRRLKSLTDYVLVSAEQISVEHFTRQTDGTWSFHAYDQPDQQLVLASVGCEVPVTEIYDKVAFPEPGSTA